MKSKHDEMIVWETEQQRIEPSKGEALQALLANPSVAITRDGVDQYYYSATQIQEAYNIGASLSKRKRTKDAVYTVIRNMNVGDCLYFPFEKYGAVRTTASKLKSEFSVQYITKVVHQHEKKEVRITRLK